MGAVVVALAIALVGGADRMGGVVASTWCRLLGETCGDIALGGPSDPFDGIGSGSDGSGNGSDGTGSDDVDGSDEGDGSDGTGSGDGTGSDPSGSGDGEGEDGGDDPDGDAPADPADPEDGTDSRTSPEEILEDYQVDPDPAGTTEYPDFPENLIVDEQTVTATEAEMLDDLSIGGKLDMKQMRDDAFAAASELYPGESNDSHQDAFRHAYWNALMTRRFGVDWAERYGTAHEALAGNPADREAMDLYNNEVGRDIAVANPDASPEELADLVREAVERGDTVVIDGDGDLARSDDVPVGETGEADDPPRDDGEGMPIPGGDPDAEGDYDS